MTPVEEFLAERLRLSAITPAQAKYAGIRAMLAAEAQRQGYEYCPDGFLIPYYTPDGKPVVGMWRYRKMKHRRDNKYTQPSGTGCWVYYPRIAGLDWRRLLADPKIAVFIVEGELKALALCLAGIPAVAIGGVWNWVRFKELLPELTALATGGRDLWIAFDSDAEDKPQVAFARYRLAKALLDARGVPHILVLREHPAMRGEKCGVDDLVRLTGLRDAKLRAYLQKLEDEEKFPLAHVLYRFNSEYVINLETTCVHQTRNVNRQWSSDRFCSVVVADQLTNGVDVEGKVTKKPAGRAWIGWKQRNTVVGRTYRPLPQDVPRDQVLYVAEDGERYLNNWRGWASVPDADPEGVAKFWTPLLDHLFKAKSNENEKQTKDRLGARTYCEQWIAYPVQHPGAKIFSVLCLLGRQGGGKSMVGDTVRLAVYGEHFQEIEQSSLESEFNANYTEAKSLVMGSEITSRDFNKKRGLAERLKYLITSPTLEVNQKNKPKYNLRNRINFLLTSNYDDAFLLANDDRRYFLWAIPDIRLADALGKTWLDAAWKYAESPKGKAALQHHLLNLDLSGFDPHVPPPDTEAKRNAKEYSQNQIESWIAEFAEDPEGKTQHPGETVWREEELWNLCKPEVGESYTQQTFRKHLREKFMYMGRASVPTRVGPGRVVNRKWVYKWERIKTGL